MFRLPINDSIYLKLMLPKDAEILVSALKENQEQIKQWLIWAVNLPTVDVYKKEIIPTWLQKFANNNGFEAAIFVNDELAGMIGLHYIDWNNKTTEMGYWLGEKFQGKGIMTKTVEKLTDYCFEELELNRIMIRAVDENTKSRGIPIRIGFVEEGITREAQLLHGKYCDLVNYSLLRKDRN
ncbi:GNAT family N-acetyltransferase [Bacillus sp. RG28]|uniref:GNAT family N-acetyltransferase n=1 Tax=Gottfriedia endophytica TaxID=2820819 RepID=A0A940NPA3_9BACI|nr:GNAT family protein [Gottfriedia endophytica]MBP0725220.1 GNAT family N-acetyltransferase [Gottfriedia endophytica]